MAFYDFFASRLKEGKITYVTCTPQAAMPIKANSFLPIVSNFFSSDCNYF